MSDPMISPVKRSLWSRLTRMSSAQLAAWSKTRLRGRDRFIRFWVLGWGGCLFAVSFLQDAFRDYGKHHDLARAIIVPGITNIIFWPLAGYVAGAWTWSRAEKQFHESGWAGVSMPEPPTTPAKYDY